MSILTKLRLTLADPEPTAEPEPSATGCTKCEPAPFDRGPRFGGHVAARGRGLPIDNGLKAI
ncbi:hypothetical protein [Mycobacterium sp. D16R24]|uniref:hypothetical protein n=1 Tax=Mycobacterium sp. D16R24 TaxID=1855656 RepID=UPI0009932D0E|nr:hypothetical protein [Mycobacterium sp. D16R24]